MNNCPQIDNQSQWPPKPDEFSDLMTPVEAAMFLRLNEIGHNPKSAQRTLSYWRERGYLRATKYARHVWFLKNEFKQFHCKCKKRARRSPFVHSER